MPLRVLYCDIDGTLTRAGSLLLGEDGPSAAAAEGLVRLARAGVEVVPCTGRRPKEMPALCRLLGVRAFVAELGAVVGLDGGATLLRTYEPPGGVPAGRALLESGVVARLLGANRGKLEMHEPWAREREHTVLMRGAVDVAAVGRILPPGVVLVDNGEIEAPEKSELALPVWHSYHLTYASVSKSAGVRFDLARRKLAPEDAAFVGDSPHDGEMVGAVGRVLLLGESAPGAETVPQRYGDGFLVAVERLFRA